MASSYIDVISKYNKYIETVNLSCGEISISHSIYNYEIKNNVLILHNSDRTDSSMAFNSPEDFDKKMSEYSDILNTTWKHVNKTVSSLVDRVPSLKKNLSFDRNPKQRYFSKDFCSASVYAKIGKKKQELVRYYLTPIQFDDLVNGCQSKESRPEVYIIYWGIDYSIRLTHYEDVIKYIIQLIKSAYSYKTKEYVFNRSVKSETNFFTKVQSELCVESLQRCF